MLLTVRRGHGISASWFGLLDLILYGYVVVVLLLQKICSSLVCLSSVNPSCLAVIVSDKSVCVNVRCVCSIYFTCMFWIDLWFVVCIHKIDFNCFYVFFIGILLTMNQENVFAWRNLYSHSEYIYSHCKYMLHPAGQTKRNAFHCLLINWRNCFFHITMNNQVNGIVFITRCHLHRDKSLAQCRIDNKADDRWICNSNWLRADIWNFNRKFQPKPQIPHLYISTSHSINSIKRANVNCTMWCAQLNSCICSY